MKARALIFGVILSRLRAIALPIVMSLAAEAQTAPLRPVFAPPQLRGVPSILQPSLPQTGIGVASLDVNDDRIPDLMILGSPQFGTLLGDGRGNFAVDVQPAFSGYSAGAFAGRIVVADVDGDGVEDQAGTNIVYGARLPPYWNAPAQPLPTPFQVLGVGDANGDNLPDLFGATPSGQPGCLLNLGSRVFASTFTPVGTSPIPLAGPPLTAGVVADFNRDGRPDFAVANRSLDVYLSTGPLAWARIAVVPSFGSLGYQSLLEAADFDGDGLLDLVAMGSLQPALFPHAMRVFRCVGSGGVWQFLPAQETAVPVDPPFTMSFCSAVGAPPDNPAMAIADFNVDGRPDVALLRNGEERLKFLFGTGGGDLSYSPGSTVLLPPNTCSHHLVAGDFDLDGRPDLVSGFFGAQVNGSYYFHRNITPLAASASRFGAGAQGTGAMPPTLGVSGLPFQGRSRFDITVHAAVPASLSWLVLSFGSTGQSIPGSGCVAYADLNTALWPFPGLPMVTDGYGASSLSFDLGSVTNAIGLQLTAQVWMFNPAAPAQVATSDALLLTIG